MSWSYSKDPASSSKDAVRYLVGDTQEDEAFVTDEEIMWVLGETPNIYSAASSVALNLSAYFATQAQQIKVGPLVEIFSKRSEYYTVIAKNLELKASRSSSVISFSGTTSKSANFTIGMHDFISTASDLDSDS